MKGCEPIRRVLFRVADGEATPDEAIGVARHVPDCTACRILLARERRLRKMLEHDLEDFPVGEDFVQSVMATLPQDPPPQQGRSRRRSRGLKLACFIGLAGLLALPGIGGVAFGIGARPDLLPRLDADSAMAGLQALAGLALMAAGALQSLTQQLPLALPALPSGSVVGMVVVLPTLVGLGLISALVAFGARVLAGSMRGAATPPAARRVI